jgi:hypothetical protein
MCCGQLGRTIATVSPATPSAQPRRGALDGILQLAIGRRAPEELERRASG